MGAAPKADNGGPMENAAPVKPLILEKVKSFTAKYLDLLAENEIKDDDEYVDDSIMDDFEGKAKTIEEKTNQLMNRIDQLIGNKTDRKTLTESARKEKSVEEDIQDIL